MSESICSFEIRADDRYRAVAKHREELHIWRVRLNTYG